MALPRFQLFEFEDLPWFPSVIRNLATDYLRFMENRFKLHESLVPLLKQAIEDSQQTCVVDLCSGGGGPVMGLLRELTAEGVPLVVTLTDRFPNLNAMSRLAALDPARIGFHPEPVDATAVPADVRGLRTIFNAFHHFAPVAARAVLQNAVDARQPICICDASSRSIFVLLVFFLNPIYVWLATPFIRPFRASRLLFTYLLPLVPLICWWDGLVSALRSYSMEEMLALTRNFEGYTWRAGRVRLPWTLLYITWLRGIPVDA